MIEDFTIQLNPFYLHTSVVMSPIILEHLVYIHIFICIYTYIKY